MALVHREPRKKYNSNVESAPDIALYLVTTGPAKNIWAMSTMSKRELVELVPVFDTEAYVVDLLENLKDKSYQAALVSLTKLSSLVKERNVLFILNPNIKIQDGQICFKEGPNWNLPLDRLSILLSVDRDRCEKNKV